ncbi:HNH endonuclease [Streptomyces olivaceus]|uniref:HNH endonuclease n=1 Tax=Streptomyces olivaceus TaxID=47716 RepID=UPI001CCD4C19|nr:HNH endonuclease [Streptomyces olivaceus]MBZ6207569.1 HNH endonuclease [Streptomyces olivaceus]
MTDTRPTKWAVVQYWATAPLGHEVFAPHLDVNTPCCFACGWLSERWTDGRSARKAWERATLERAHIIPAGLGGPNGTDNIILLCGPCHRESPDWHDPWEMATWISNRPERASKEMEHVDTWLRAAADVPLFAVMLREVSTGDGSAQDVVDVMRRYTRCAVVHAGELSQGTITAVLRATVRELLP